MTQRRTIAIDGPGASGKNTVGLLLAQRLKYRFVDTGAMYRALTWLALRRGLDFENESSIVALAERTRLRIVPSSPEVPQGGIFVRSLELTPFLHTPEVDAQVSLLSRVPGVRAIMVRMQRRMVAEGGVVMVGRDIGTVVLPDATLKVFLDAPAEERARRRYFEEQAAGETSLAYDDVLRDLRQRDDLDQQRATSPMRPADDAWVIDTQGKPPQAIVEAILERLSQIEAA